MNKEGSMTKVEEMKNRYTTPRKIQKSEKPSKTSEKVMKDIMAYEGKNIDKILQRTKKLSKEVEEHNRQVDIQFLKESRDIANKMKKEGEKLTWADLQGVDRRRCTTYRDAYWEASTETAYKYITVPRCRWNRPVIRNITITEILPGDSIQIKGLCFGTSMGWVYFQLAQDSLIELVVDNWTDTCIDAHLNRLIGEIPLRPYNGKIWLKTAEGKISNDKPLRYIPFKQCYYAFSPSWEIFGRIAGNHKDATFLNNKTLGDNDFKVVSVRRHHWGDGWSELREPMAGGQSMAQGYHIGVDAWHHAHMDLLYIISGPKGIYPRTFDDLGPYCVIG